MMLSILLKFDINIFYFIMITYQKPHFFNTIFEYINNTIIILWA